MKGLFVVLEGIDGSGKSTIANVIVDKLQSMGLKAISTQEPTVSEIGKILRKYLSDPTSIPESDALLFAADRVEHFHQFILPHVTGGYIVICDRYKYSSIVYQGSQNVDKNWIVEINRKAGDPDLVFYLNLSIESALNRLIKSERNNIEKFENKSYLTAIAEGYELLIHNDKVKIIDVDEEIDEIAKTIVGHILEFLE